MLRREAGDEHMSAFVLIHGSGQNARCWETLTGLLEARRHAVVAPDLPKLKTEWGLREYGAFAARAIEHQKSVVVAHSFSGALLPYVAAHGGCRLLVFLAAVIPEPGKSVREQFGEDPGMFNPEWIAAGFRWTDPRQHEHLAREFLFHDCDDETAADAMSSLEMFDTRHLVTEKAPFSSWPDVPTASIVATRDRTLTPEWGRRTSHRVLGVESVEIEAGHCPFLSKPEELAIVLERLAS